VNWLSEPAHRRCGYAQACLTALLTWFQKDTGVRVVNLHATLDGARMYPSAGFSNATLQPLTRALLRLLV
jgi:hypothetical protein